MFTRLVCVLAFAVSASLPSSGQAPANAPRVRPVPTKVLRCDDRCWGLQGDVIGIDGTWVAIGPGLGWNKPDCRAVVLPFHTVLHNGGVHDFSHDSRAYRKTDLLVGDNVCIEVFRDNGNDFCAELTIRKRPGGFVPPSVRFREAKGLRWPPYHIRMNVFNWLEDGLPVPEWMCKLTGNEPPRKK